jgi:hypothetical protein
MFFQLSASFHYSIAKQFHYGLKNKTSRSEIDFLRFKRFFDCLCAPPCRFLFSIYSRYLTRMLSISIRLSSLARSRGVCPKISFLVASTSCSIKNCTTLICPVSTAECKAVCLDKLTVFKLAPANLKQLIFFFCPSLAKPVNSSPSSSDPIWRWAPQAIKVRMTSRWQALMAQSNGVSSFRSLKC